MFHDKSWKPIYFGVKRSKVKITRSVSVLQILTYAYTSRRGQRNTDVSGRILVQYCTIQVFAGE